MLTQSQLCKKLQKRNDSFIKKFEKLGMPRTTAKRAKQARRSYKKCMKMPRDKLIEGMTKGKNIQDSMYEGYKMQLKLDPAYR